MGKTYKEMDRKKLKKYKYMKLKRTEASNNKRKYIDEPVVQHKQQ